MPPQTNIERDKKEKEGYKQELAGILGGQLTVENIDSYADTALESLIGLSERVVHSYQRNQEEITPLDSNVEDVAFKKLQLGDVTYILDHLAQKSNEISALNGVITNIQVIGDVITPPDVMAAMAIVNGAGTFERPLTMPRLKTILFILENTFSIDVKDPAQIDLKKGTLKGGMMRRESYYSVQLPGLNRTILVCDEEKNATFVFNNEALKEGAISYDDLIGLTKQEIKGLIEDDSSIGMRIIYSAEYVRNVISALKNKDQPEDETESAEKFLYPPAPEGIFKLSTIADNFGTTKMVLSRIVKLIPEEEMGVVNKYKYHFNISRGYTSEQQALIYSYAQKEHVFAGAPPEDFLNVVGIGESLGLSRDVVGRAIAKTKNLGEVKEYRYKIVTSPWYSVEQQALIYQTLVERGLFADIAPEGFENTTSLAVLFDIGRVMLEQKIIELGDQLGKVKKYRFPTMTTFGYSPEQQAIIRGYLEQTGAISERAPEDYWTIRRMKQEWDVSFETIKLVVKELGETLGEVMEYRPQNNLKKSYSPEQRVPIYEKLEERGVFLDDAPEGYEPVSGMSEKWDVKHGPVIAAIKYLIGLRTLGEVGRYKFGVKATDGYSPSQQTLVHKRLEANGLFEPLPPEGYLSIRGLGQLWGVEPITLKRAIDDVRDLLGEVGKYKFGNSRASGYSPEQQMIIKTRHDLIYKTRRTI